MRELVALKEAESAHLSKIITSAFIRSHAAGRETVCDEESRAVATCYQSNRTDGDTLQCEKLVDTLELCASNASCNQ